MLSIQNVTFNYENQPLFDNVNLELGAGEFAFLIGKSGSGKTTLLQMVYMNVIPDSGSVSVGSFNSKTIKKSELPHLRRKIGIVFQDFKLLNDRNVFENLSFVLEVTATPKREIKKRVNDVLNEVGLSHKRLTKPDKLSGGEKQKVAIARAILNDPLIILADEPTGNLDPETSGEILDLLQKINKRGTAILVATHNYDMVRKGNTRVFKIESGKILKGYLKQKDQ
ncbi:MAG TPA: cell division ATP-binding protein FtsE [Ignavibacteriaceae bacterium]|jgi:cell division transport system ATP-binding protein|nr:MAG: Cell division ATP-binding protein FtsE [Ignavibacteria bacterium ADurb.Bin266]OQY71080.1 MAG: cell division ATP-binding protein FtsE [Ignavibacteriales bacterium UTCHB2]HQF43874.1 cell division ATP-binding protein FtsE [Ignavibacteriaceae bacterium]HQI40435.1 cell division ATP-binding protein FtsE [Ignavibacteriaceae bacterium]HQJ46480.1 cell division ATP-binding protein FtsE [Ignavibacteriaceae bacterium]